MDDSYFTHRLGQQQCGYSAELCARLEDAGYVWTEPVYRKTVRVKQRTARKEHRGYRILHRTAGYKPWMPSSESVTIKPGDRYTEETLRECEPDGVSWHMTLRTVA